ncbi:MAG: PEGA domain-containing protein [Gammaproteobacteria bacterium]|nr:PEGA domain-containing protein [Gammaproteobacteria bacterium]
MTLVGGCASITRGTSESFVIETVPAGANVTLSTGLTCTSPCSLKVKRRGDFVVTIKKDGYETITSTVTSSIDGGGGAAMAGNVLLGGIIGAGIDAGTGAMHSHRPNPLVVTLNPEAD